MHKIFLFLLFKPWKKKNKDKHLHIAISSSVPFDIFICSHHFKQTQLRLFFFLKKHKVVNEFLLSARNDCVESPRFSQFNLWVFRGRQQQGLDLRQLGNTDKRVGLLQKSPSGTFIVIGAVVSLCVAVGGAKVVTTSERFKQIDIQVCVLTEGDAKDRVTWKHRIGCGAPL